jgi:hypothetical protein
VIEYERVCEVGAALATIASTLVNTQAMRTADAAIGFGALHFRLGAR